MPDQRSLRQQDTRRFEPPMSAADVRRLPKRERLDLLKPILRAHERDNEALGPQYTQRERDPYRDSRWTWLYAALGETGGRGELEQARQEIHLEDEHGRYWPLASVSINLIDDGWNRWEVDVHFPRAIRRGENGYVHGPDRRFRTRFFAARWGARQKRRYERYIRRLLDAGLYDDWRYER